MVQFHLRLLMEKWQMLTDENGDVMLITIDESDDIIVLGSSGDDEISPPFNCDDEE